MVLSLWTRIGIGLGLASTLAYMTTPVAILVARRCAFLDRPAAAAHKGHVVATPYLGGAAVMLAFILAVVVGAGDPGRTLPLIGGVVVLLVTGTVDDRRSLSPRLRVMVELAVGALLAAAGLGWNLGAGGIVDAAVTGLWVVAVVNAFNLFDNMDGAASTMALVAAGGTCVLASLTGDGWVAAGSAALCGACLGFLPHNLTSPARIFLGDGGSMPLGFAVAALVANAARGAEPSALALLAGVLLVGVPVLDTTLVIVSRRRRGAPVLTGGRDHLTHRTRRWMRTARRVAVVLGSAQLLISALVIAATRAGPTDVIYIGLAFVVGAAAAIVALDHVPFEQAPSTGMADGFIPATSWRKRLPVGVGLAVLGLGAGLSPLFAAYYDTGVWVSIGLVLVVLAAAVSIAWPPRWTWPAVLVLAGLAGLGLLSLLSASWAQAAEAATIDGNRWLAYGAFLLLALTLVRTTRHAHTVLGALGVGIAIVAASVLARMLSPSAAVLFLGGRLNGPLGYVNGEACMFAMGAWLGVALAECDEPVLAGFGALGAVVLADLALLSQSRGAAIATFITLLTSLALLPGRRRRILALVVIAGAVAAAAHPVIELYTLSRGGWVDPVIANRAARAILLSGVGAGLLWGLAVAGARAIHRRNSGAAAWLNGCATIAAAGVIAVAVGAGLLGAGPLERAAREQWHAFVHLSDAAASPAGESRLLSGAGNRYDYWRIAWHVFLAHPLAGVGAGNYDHYYYLQRRTAEAIQNPHSLELQTLAEQGIAGGLLLGLLILGTALGTRRLRRRALASPHSRPALVGAVGCTLVWLVDASGDWMHLLPGVTATALLGVAVLCHGQSQERLTSRPDHGGGNRSEPEPAGMLGDARGAAGLSRAGEVPRSLRLRTVGAAAAVAFVLAVAGASLLRSWLANHYLQTARAALVHSPAAAVADAARSLRLDPANLDAYYIEAAGEARFDRGATARSILLAAVRQDRGAFVPLVLLGDLEVRLDDLTAARRYYRRALQLDPHDAVLAGMARHPDNPAEGNG